MASLVDNHGNELVRVNDKRGTSAYANERSSIDTWLSNYLLPANQFVYNGYTYGFGQSQAMGPSGGPNLTYGSGRKAQEISATLSNYSSVLKQSPPAFAAQMVRAMVLSQARFTFRGKRNNKNPRKTFGTSALSILENPWPNGSTSELISKMEWHAGLAGNAYVVNRRNRLRVLRPDWVVAVYGSELDPDDPTLATDSELIGYLYVNGGFNKPGARIESFTVDEVAHWTPIPDPEKASLGMSWITPAIRELQADQAATEHKLKFFLNGAPQPLSAGILTPAGWSTMGEMSIGAEVIGSNGKARTVTAVYPQGEQDIYRVTFTNGASTECTRDHIWTVASIYDRQRGVTRDMTLSEIIDGGVCYGSGPAKWSVPLVSPVEFGPLTPLTIHPYLLGSLLGDGYLKGNSKGSGSATIACHSDDADEQENILKSMLPIGNRIARRDRGGWSEFNLASAPGPSANPLSEMLKDLGLWGAIGYDKFIPEQYMRASIDDRISLVQGLIDTDGSVERNQPNTIRFSNTSSILCDQLAELVRGLGGTASVMPVRRSGNRQQWRVTVSKLPSSIIPCRLARKVNIYSSQVKGGQYHYIRSVEYVRREQAQCISVDTLDSLYVTDDYILTHNTPNLVVKGIPAADKATFDMFVDLMEERHTGVANAYRTLYLTSGADATVVGSNLEQISFAETQGASETRITALSRVPAVMIGLSEGLKGAALNAGNFGQVRRMFADTWIFPQLESLSSCLASIVNVPTDAELWYDVYDMPVLREDAIDAAAITQVQAQTIGGLVRDGFTPESSVVAVLAGDMTKLVPIPGWISVQLQQMNGQTTPKQISPAGES